MSATTQVWSAVLDDATCAWCRQRHGKPALSPSPALRCTNPQGCRCRGNDPPPALLPTPTLLVQSAGVPVVLDVTWDEDVRGFLHALYPAAPTQGDFMACPGLDVQLRVTMVVFQPTAVVVHCRAEWPMGADERAELVAAGWGILP